MARQASHILDKKIVLNLSGTDLPPEAISVLGKCVGFVPTTPHDSLLMKNDCRRTMAKLSLATRRRLCAVEGNQRPETDNHPTLPPSLRREKILAVDPTGDKFIDQLASEVIAEVDQFVPPKVKSNLTKPEQSGIKWVKNKINHGNLRLVSADKGGALCGIPKNVMREWELEKLNDQARYENIGSRDPIPDAHTELLQLWRDAEDNKLVQGMKLMK